MLKLFKIIPNRDAARTTRSVTWFLEPLRYMIMYNNLEKSPLKFTDYCKFIN
jgi:hypothetical protein